MFVFYQNVLSVKTKRNYESQYTEDCFHMLERCKKSKCIVIILLTFSSCGTVLKMHVGLLVMIRR